MATNVFFDTYSNFSEQNLVEDLIIESIKIHGKDLWYICRDRLKGDVIFNENTVNVFNAAYLLEAYIKNVDAFEGDGDFLSKFGLQIRDSITFTVSIRRFSEEIGRHENISRAYEGDLIYFPLNNKLFEIKHVEHESIFYQMGSLQVYDLKCELFEYSNERFETGEYEIDSLLDQYKIDDSDNINTLAQIDPIAENLDIEAIANTVLDFSEINPFGDDIF